MFLAEYDLEEFPLLLWSLLLLLISGLLLLNITSCSSPATKCDFVILSVSCSSHISWKGIIILIEEEKKYRILYVCVHMYTRNRRVKGERSEEGIKWINTNNKIWSSVFVPSNFTFFFFFGLQFLSISSLIVLTCRMADIWNELCLMNPDSQLCSLTPCQQPVTHLSHVMPSHHGQVRSRESLKYVSGIMKHTLRSLSKSIWLLKIVYILILLSSQLLIHQKCIACWVIPLVPCNDWGGMRKPKRTCVQLFPIRLQVPISVRGICVGYYFPLLKCPIQVPVLFGIFLPSFFFQSELKN